MCGKRTEETITVYIFADKGYELCCNCAHGLEGYMARNKKNVEQKILGRRNKTEDDILIQRW